MTQTFKIIKINKATSSEVEDSVAREIPFTIIVNNEELVTLQCSPLSLEDLALGFLFTSGLIQSASDVKNIAIDTERWVGHVELAGSLDNKEMLFKRMYTSGCGRGTLFYNPLDILHRGKLTSNLSVDPPYVAGLMRRFQKGSHLYLKTGGVHSAAIADNREIIVFREDIGRHNAIDKVAGSMMSQGVSFSDKMLVTSGRVSSEVIFKVRRIGLPVIISKSAPTDQAIRHAREMNITLIGFARGLRMNIYSAPERISKP